jgi:hypothetical protein
MLSVLGERRECSSLQRARKHVHGGKLVPRDPARGMDLFEQACRLGSDGGCANVAIQFLFHQNGQGFDETIGEALARIEQASDEATRARRTCSATPTSAVSAFHAIRRAARACSVLLASAA